MVLVGWLLKAGGAVTDCFASSGVASDGFCTMFRNYALVAIDIEGVLKAGDAMTDSPPTSRFGQILHNFCAHRGAHLFALVFYHA